MHLVVLRRPRSIAYRDWIFTGCISPDGSVKLDEYNLGTGQKRLLTLFRGLESDDHNNPSLVFFKRSSTRSRRSTRATSTRSTATRGSVPRVEAELRGRHRLGPDVDDLLGSGCGLGYTYPNPVVSNGRLYLFMRGPCWYPYYTSTKDGKHWTSPKTMVLGPPPRAATSGRTRSTSRRPTARS